MRLFMKKDLPKQVLEMHTELLLSRSADRARICASAAIDANFRIDDVWRSLGNSRRWATVCASTATDALITDLISHDRTSLQKCSCILKYKEIIA